MLQNRCLCENCSSGKATSIRRSANLQWKLRPLLLTPSLWETSLFMCEVVAFSAGDKALKHYWCIKTGTNSLLHVMKTPRPPPKRKVQWYWFTKLYYYRHQLIIKYVFSNWTYRELKLEYSIKRLCFKNSFYCLTNVNFNPPSQRI